MIAGSYRRLDVWLWHARFIKTRSGCVELAASGAVRINRQLTVKPHALVRTGDVLTVAAHGGVRVVRVLALAERRGPATEARRLYDELSEDAPTCAVPQRPALPPHGAAESRHRP